MLDLTSSDYYNKILVHICQVLLSTIMSGMVGRCFMLSRGGLSYAKACQQSCTPMQVSQADRATRSGREGRTDSRLAPIKAPTMPPMMRWIRIADWKCPADK